MDKIFFRSISSLSEYLKNKEVSPVELTAKLLERIEKIEPSLNAFITVLADDAMKEAERAEQELLAGNVRSPLHGVPIAIKDIFETKNRVTTAGSKIFEYWKPDRDAVVIQRLKEAGAIIIGKTNLHEFAMGATTENPHYGPTRNPWNLNKIPGGSSGGSAAAVAAGMCYGALGTDTGGSIRLPAAICGIVGLKPTYDLVSRKGCVPLSWTFDHIGPMTRTVEDSAIMLRVLAEQDQLRKTDISMDFNKEQIKGVRIGIVHEYFFEQMDHEMKEIVEQAIRKLSELGAEIVEINLSGIAEALEAQKMISKSEAYSFHESMFTKYPEMYGDDSNIRLSSGRAVTASEYLHAQKVRKQFIQSTLEAMSECDVMLTPTNTIIPYDIGTIGPEQSIPNIFNLGRTPIGNFLGFPALNVPCGFTREQLPVGMQLIGKPYSEGLLLEVGHVYEKSEKWVGYLEKNKAYELNDSLA
ncbi:amidase [Priestia abyssalis]|uniref:amidase n=1 Tax=Priestia abyssalis TaxID=1221450 RepID=UPI0009953B5F|nr:amidase [Priestia abyssalis]